MAEEKQHQSSHTEYQIRVDGKPVYWPSGLYTGALEKYAELCEQHPDCYVDIVSVRTEILLNQGCYQQLKKHFKNQQGAS